MRSQPQFLSTLSLRRATKSNKLAGKKLVFLSTLSLRRATADGLFLLGGRENFYPRSPCGERRASNHRGRQGQRISIHALLAESDKQTKAFKVSAHSISIHALLAESDNPESAEHRASSQFLSTLSLRRATH